MKLAILPYLGVSVTLSDMFDLLNNIWAVYLETAVWLIFGLITAGLVKVYIPADAMQRWLGGKGFAAVGRAALFGAPLPLCSCGVLPAALGLRRAGASKEATISFLISTPETSIDSVAVTYALMGPLMAIYRPISALLSALITGAATALVDDDAPKRVAPVITGCCNKEAVSVTCCESIEKPKSSCCDSPDESANLADKKFSGESSTDRNKIKQALRFAGAELLDDISKWLAFGIVFAGIMMTLIPEGWLAQWGQGLTAMLVMLVVGIPMYICAVASTPVAAGLLLAGVSPGAVLVFLLVGPATNIASLILVQREMGTKVTFIYVGGIALCSVSMGLLLEWLMRTYNLQIHTTIQQSETMLPYALSLISAIFLLLLVVPQVRNRLMPFFDRAS